jgi:hypothetical protein
MKKKKSSQGASVWKARQLAIHSADSLMTKAHALFAADRTNPKQATANLRKAALFYEAAARAYRRGTLGLMARKPWAAAKECYRELGDDAGVSKCDRLRKAIPTYWEDGHSSAPEES